MKTQDFSNEHAARLVESFSKHIKTYDKHAQLQKSMAERLASFLPDPLPDRILEIGCGTGVFTRHLLALGAKELILNDLAPAMIKHFLDTVEVGVPISVVPGNAENIEFPKVRLAAANAVFQWFQNPVSALINIGQSLEAGGVLAFSVFGPKTLSEFRETGNLKSPNQLYGFEEWEDFLHQSGFELLESQSEIRKTFFPDALSMVRNLRQIGATPLRMVNPGELRKLARDYDAAFGSSQGVYSTWELYFFSAEKN